jgi:glycosyltransferase involved in cell wall biosynthesis
MPLTVPLTLTVSFIISTRNRAEALPGCFSSVEVACSKCPTIDVELVVVDNGSSDGTQEIIRHWAQDSCLPITVVSETTPGLSRARNRGIEAAKGELLVFTDDDCRLQPDYLTKLIAHYLADTDPVMRGGRVELGDPLDLPITIKRDMEPAELAHPIHPAGFLLGANMALPRKIIENIGHFDECLGAGTPFPGEDADYVVRTVAKGFRVCYAPDLVVYHFHGRRDLESAKRLLAGYMRANGALYIKHLAIRPMLLKYFWWDLKFWVRELRGETNELHAVGFGHREVVLHSFDGMIRYLVHSIKRTAWLAMLKLGVVRRSSTKGE